MSGKGLGAYNKAPTKEIAEKWERLDRKGDKIKFVDVRLLPKIQVLCLVREIFPRSFSEFLYTVAKC